MKKILLVLMAVLFLSAPFGFSDSKKKQENNLDTYRYDVEYVKTMADGMVAIKVWTYHKSRKFEMDQCRKNAVHAIIFKGYAGAGSSHAPLVKDMTTVSQHGEFFDIFFNGEYAKFVTNIQNGSIETVKVGKEYKTGVIATVNSKALRKQLEQAGIIKGLSSGF